MTTEEGNGNTITHTVCDKDTTSTPTSTATPTPTCPIHTVLDATGDCVSLAVAQDIQNGIVPIADGKLRLATVPPVPNTNTIGPICPDISHLVGSKCVMNGQGCEPGYVQDEDICTPTTRSLPVYPGGTTGSGGGFIQMIPTCASGAPPDANGKCPTPTSSPTTPTGNTGGRTGTTTNTGGTTNTTKTPMNTGTPGTGGGTTTTTTSAKTTTTNTTPKQTGTTSGSTGTPTSTSKATTTKIINNNVIRGFFWWWDQCVLLPTHRQLRTITS